jgi:ribosomal protein S18 acetylase RimI-like enzyme
VAADPDADRARRHGASSNRRWRVTSGRQDPGAVARLLGLLPTWFGIPESNAAYVQSARELPTYLARPDDDAAAEPGGVLLASRHFPGAAEIHLLAVDPGLHRRGVGRALVRAFEADLAADGVGLLQVKTLGPSHPDPGYKMTRLFYAGMGFQPLEEIHGLWGPANPCLIMVKLLEAGGMAGTGAHGQPAAQTEQTTSSGGTLSRS